MIAYGISLILAISLLILAKRYGALSTVDNQKGIKRILVCKDRSGAQYSLILVVLSASVFIFLTGFRYGVGQDYFYTYVPYFQRVYYGMGQGDLEFGFYALNQIVAWFTNDPTPVFFVCSLIFFICTYMAVFRESESPIFSIFLIFGMSFLFIFMNAMRQMVAVSILLFSLRYIENHKPIPFVISLLIASLFHSSAVIFAVAYFFPKLKINLFGGLVAVVVVFLFRSQIADVVNYVISLTSYAGYIGSVFDTKEAGNVIMAMNVIVLLFSLLIPYLEKTEMDKKYRLLVWCQMIATIVAILSGYIPLSQRIRWIFSLSSIVLLPLAVQKISSPQLRLLVQAAVVVLYVVYIYITIGLWNGNNVVPYQCVLFRG